MSPTPSTSTSFIARLRAYVERRAYGFSMLAIALGVAGLSGGLTTLALGEQIGSLASLFDRAEPAAPVQTAGMRLPRHLSREMLRESEGTYLGLEFDRLPWASTIRAGGERYARGIAMHAPPSGTARATFSVPPGATHFVALVGLADGADPDAAAACAKAGGSARFAIHADGLAITEPIEARGAPGPTHRLRIALPAYARTLELAVDNLDGKHDCDTAVWLEPRFDMLGKFPTEVAALREGPPGEAAPMAPTAVAAANPSKPADTPKPVIEIVDAQTLIVGGVMHTMDSGVGAARNLFSKFKGDIVIRVPQHLEDEVVDQLTETLARLGVGQGFQIEATGFLRRPTS